MKIFLVLVFLGFLPVATVAQSADEGVDSVAEAIILDGTGENLEQFVWINRPLIVFADSPADPRYVEQMALISARLDALRARDVVVLTDTNPSARSPLRQKLHPRGFMLVLIGKDGTIYLRKPLPWDVREITRTIDKLPMRKQEVREQSGAS